MSRNTPSAPPFPRALLLMVAALLGGASVGTRAAAAEDGAALFRQQILPVLTGKCLTCHAGDRKKGKLDLSRRETARAGGRGGPALVPGEPGKSLLFEKVAAGAMPPQNPLAPEQVAAF